MAGRNLLQRIFEPALRAAGLRKVSFHALRHSYVSLLLSQGESIKFISRQVGHSSAKLTLDIYSHLLEGAQGEAMRRLGNDSLAVRSYAKITIKKEVVTWITTRIGN